jgi:hypothetical protein
MKVLVIRVVLTPLLVTVILVPISVGYGQLYIQDTITAILNPQTCTI